VQTAVDRVDRLGTASERLFSRIYRSITRRAKAAQAGAPREDTQALRRVVRARDREIERLGAVLATIEEGVIMQDDAGRVVLINDAARALLGSVKAFWESELGTLFNQFREETLSSELTPMGKPARVQVNNRILGAQLAVVAGDDGARLGVLIVLRDITHDVLSERLKNQFVAAISHELRTPMAVIKGMSEVLIGHAEQGKAPNPRLLHTLSRNVDILDRMIVELLDISALNDDAIQIEKAEVAVEPLLWSIVKGQMPEIVRGGLDVTVMVQTPESLRVHGDEQKLRWALGHLVQNAVRYTEPGGHLILTAAARDGALAVQVVDTGVGISERDLPHIFERFYRGEARTPAGKLIDPRGLGQGLYIAQRVAEAHGGYLSVSRQPVGSLFTFMTPLA
jgi:signal transduction histidine kinase